MPTYVAFLRAINLGANRKFAKDDIRRVVESIGFTDVETHINTGNVRFTTPMRSRAKIEKALEDAFAADRGFDVPTMVFTTAEVADIAGEAAALSAERPGLERHYVYLLKEELPPGVVARVEELATDAGGMVVRGRVAHALLGPGYQAGTVDPLGAAKLLGVATNRNVNVITAIAAKWC
ncbi:DUF1697 domain-containing protein [Microbacterium sp. QXD-8]|uniref:DUF1697 domain-containing protein n=1 Tax=Microbacterium psychrotolerans TaxID=3068321 RepID=A0ABU0YWN6_9MICO|nr:DUF1697 domain-containing protein [Microbacterium sp. QXD-8]MDQ7876725.1 DUF1697 domain-containing protein [Microbacterium sp. QXD-8]